MRKGRVFMLVLLGGLVALAAGIARFRQQQLAAHREEFHSRYS